MTKLEKVVKGLECCIKRDPDDYLRCDECPYPDGSACANRLKIDALELLKEHEPRVLTLEEATGEDECWLECNNGSCGYADCIMMFDGTVHLWRCFASIPKVMDSATYGREWRCWTSKPTDEQREAAAWQ